jgi:hypothetical protein
MKTRTSAFVLALGLAAGPAFAADTQTVTQDVKTTFLDLINKDSVNVGFKEGTSAVSKDERSDLKATVDAVRKDTKIARVIVAAWSDKEYPAGKEEALKASDKKLASDRASNVKAVLSELGVSNVETYTMTEKPNWFEKEFNTDDAKVKGAGKVKDSDDQVTTEIGRLLREKGGPKSVVVLVRRTGDHSAP